MMQTQRVAIVGLGRVGSVFLDALLKQQGKALDIVAVAESSPTPGLAMAQSRGIPVLTLPEILQRCAEIDIVFDLTGVATVRRELRDGLAGNSGRPSARRTQGKRLQVWVWSLGGSSVGSSRLQVVRSTRSGASSCAKVSWVPQREQKPRTAFALERNCAGRPSTKRSADRATLNQATNGAPAARRHIVQWQIVWCVTGPVAS